jgi:aspartate aminotransferase
LRDQKISYGADEVMCTVGAKSAILLALEAIVNDGDEVIIFAPYWVSYEEQIRLAGGVPVVVECAARDNFMPDEKAFGQAITAKTKAVIFNSPNNPTGGVISLAQLLAMARVLSGSKIWLISDEIYEKLLFDGGVHCSPASINDDMRQRTIVISGVSKAYAMTGWRVGIVAGQKLIIDAMVKLQGQQTTCLPEFIQDAAAFALAEGAKVREGIEAMCTAYSERRDGAMDLVKKRPHVVVFKPAGAFYLWIDFSHYMGKPMRGQVIKDDFDLAERMLREAHVAAVPGTPFGGKGFLRFSIASSIDAIKEAAERIAHWLA